MLQSDRKLNRWTNDDGEAVLFIVLNLQWTQYNYETQFLIHAAIQVYKLDAAASVEALLF
jgi:hypothetical protein